MGFWEQFPYTNFHEMNLEWLIKAMKDLENYVENYVAINKVAYAGIWDITKHYPRWSIVSTGNATYMSKIAVPSGIAVENGDYWIKLADLDPRIGEIINSISEINNSIGGITDSIGGITNSIGGITDSIGGITDSIGGITDSIGGITNSISALSASQSILNVEAPPENSVNACVGDGQTDDTVAFQNAINYAFNHKMLVYIPNKVLISSNINIPGGMTIFGNSNTIVNYDQNAFSNFDGLNSAIVTMNGSGLVLDDIWGGCIKNISIVNGGDTSGVGLHLNRCRYWTFDNINIINYSKGMYLTANNPVISDDNTMYNTFTNISARCRTCLELDGVLGDGQHHGNCCHNTFTNSNFDCTGIGVVLKNCDNNTFTELAVYQRDSDWAVEMQEHCRSNFFYHLQGRVLYNGCGKNYIWGYDRENGQQFPYAISVAADNFFTANGNSYFMTSGGIVQIGGFKDDDWDEMKYPSYAFVKNPGVRKCIGVCKTDDNITRYFGLVSTAPDGTNP